jgi:7-cyano-7-deazaguanine synthase in queuosine biosynthesis
LVKTSFTPWVQGPRDLRAVLTGILGSRELTPAARDLIRVGLAVQAIERGLPAAPGGNRPIAFEVSLYLEQPERWSGRAVDALQSLLAFQGDASWAWDFHAGAAESAGIVNEAQTEDRVVDRITLFSGGLDSTCGLALSRRDAHSTQLVSHYSRQKTLQADIAGELGFEAPTQIRTEGARGRGRSFFHRSFYFLCLAAAVASTYRAKRILQYENGILATALPPAPNYFMTRHAHPTVHSAAEQIFKSVLGGVWSIENPFLKRTKRECYDAMVSALGEDVAKQLAARTETCWYQHSNQYVEGRRKEVGVACGVCMPCIVRQTATGIDGTFDLSKKKIRSDATLAREFVAYREFCQRALDPQKRLRLFLELPSYVRGLSRGDSPALSRGELQGLIDRFAGEFVDVFE